MRCLTAFAAGLALGLLPASAEPPPADAEARAREALAFGEALAREGDHYRAITEFKRAAFLAAGTGTEQDARLGIGRSYQAGRKWDLAAEAFRALGGERGALGLAETLRLSGDDEAAAPAFRAFLEGYPTSPDAPLARKALAACLLRMGRVEEARGLSGGQVLEEPPEDPKRPALAGALSAVLPGAGQCYAGRPAGGAAYFLLNALLIGGAVESFDSDRNALGVLLAAGALTAYSANIYGAVGDAHKANREARDAWLRRTDDALGLQSPASARLLPGPSTGGSPALALVWTVRF